MAKIVDYYASVKNGTNKVKGVSENDWETIRDGSHLKFIDDQIHYMVASKNKYFYIKPFKNVNGKSILIDNENGIDFMRNDTIVITHKDYEIIDVREIVDAGEGYLVGDTVEVQSFDPTINITSNTYNYATLRVNSIDENGGITSLSVEEKGSFIKEISDSEEVQLTGGKGKSSKIKVIGNLKEQRISIERNIVSIERGNGNCTINLNYGIPKEITGGKVSVSKWELILSSPYQGRDQVEKICNITRDFTRNFNFPLMAYNSSNQDVAHNESVAKIDTLIKELQHRIDALENRKDL